MRWLVLLFCLALAGCLRVDIDRCSDDPPHPECALLDGGPDGGEPADATPDAR